MHACEQIAARLGVPARTLDMWLWNRGQDAALQGAAAPPHAHGLLLTPTGYRLSFADHATTVRESHAFSPVRLGSPSASTRAFTRTVPVARRPSIRPRTT